MSRPKMKDGDQKVVLNIRVKPEVFVCITKMAEMEDRPVSHVANDLLESVIREKIISIWVEAEGK